MRTAVHNAEVYPDCFARLFAVITDCICFSNTYFTVHTHCACAGSYVMSVRSGNLIFTAGHIPQQADGSLITGKVGADMTAEDAAKAAELCALHIMSTIKGVLLTFRCQQRSKLLYVLCVLYNVYCERHAFASKTQSQY
jgi:enamine deaminase RidA (YjgF/YER057c/UK114 family)